MSWEAVSALVAVLALLIIIAQQLGALNRHSVSKAREETEAKEKMEQRVGTLEREFSTMSRNLNEHVLQTGKAIEALRTEMPAAMGNAMTRAIASSMEIQEKLHREIISQLFEHARNT